MSVRSLFAFLVALAVLFAPAFSGAGDAFAALPDRSTQTMAEGHCDQAPSGTRGHDDPAEAGCCVSMCMGMAVVPAAAQDPERVESAPAVFTVPSLHLAHIGEIATPPPKRA